jgi:fructosamine-3-kinase
MFRENRLKPQIALLKRESVYSQNMELVFLCEKLVGVVHRFFQGIGIKPSLLHGDLSCNWAVDKKGDVVLFDPVPFYLSTRWSLEA